ncbi:diphthine synthase [Caldivirga sp.]|uniref:diphthine synthase n=1 Tax=Caldivirga sp. TaxID=2080243 RepID=UPI0025C2D25F|nr:diphthine synthase [Caldivirga sp.]
MSGVLYLIGVGLSPSQVTQEAINVLKNAGSVFAEEYTSMFELNLGQFLTSLIGKPVIMLSRRELEDEGGEALIRAVKEHGSAALVTIGDPMLATTHSALLANAAQMGIKVRVINGVSIVCSAISQAGLSPYKLGPVATVTYERMGVLSTRAYEVLSSNLGNGLHTLLLLDIKDDGGFMGIDDAVNIMLRIENETKLGVITGDLIAVFESRVGWGDQVIVVGPLINPPNLKAPSVIVVPGLLNPVEWEFLKIVYGVGEELLKRHVNHVKSLLNNPQFSSRLH